MKCATRKLRPPFKWHGGKTRLARRFLALFPEHDVYCEPFAGGLSVLLNKPVARHEFVGDLDFGLIRAWLAIRDLPRMIRFQLKQVDYSQETFDFSTLHLGGASNLNHALSFICRNRMSRGGLGKDFAWSDRERGGQPGDVNAWETFIEDDFPRIVERIQRVDFRVVPAIQTIETAMSMISDKTLIYADPPYLHETRTHTKAYAHEMSPDDHHDLLSALKRADERGAKVFLSGYESELYRLAIPADWKRHTFDMPNNSGQGKVKQRRTEILWESPDR